MYIVYLNYHRYQQTQLTFMTSNLFRIFIIGTTGVGKTKLSIQLAKYLNGEIISCDSKQLYKHATIMTAKVTEQQAEGIPHYMIDCLQLTENTYNRNKYFRQSYKYVKEIEKRDKHAIIVGGTNYYIETLLYNIKKLSQNVADSQQSEGQNEKISFLKPQQQQKLKNLQTLTKQQKYQILQHYDPLIANKIHKNNQQKINLFLQRIIKQQNTISQNYQSITQELRNQNTIVFWLRNRNKQQLFEMITKRIYKMTDKNGLTQILSIFYYVQLYKKGQSSGQEGMEQKFEEYSGAASSIGIKQFLPFYLQVKAQLKTILSQNNGLMMTYQQIYENILKNFDILTYQPQTLKRNIQQLILDTKHYCKRQVTWIKNRIFINSEQTKLHFFALDLGQQQNQQQKSINQRFQLQIKQKAISIIKQIKQKGFGSILQDQEQFRDEKKMELSQWKKYYCQACDIQINGVYDWNSHNSSKKHIKNVKYVEKKGEREDYILKQRQLAKIRKQNKQQLNKADKNVQQGQQ